MQETKTEDDSQKILRLPLSLNTLKKMNLDTKQIRTKFEQEGFVVLPPTPGVWIKDRKIGAVGVAISGGVTRHGVAFNVCPDLSAYSKIIACGDPVAEATSLKHELTNVDLDPGDVAIQLSQNFLKRIQFHGEEVALPDVNKLVNILGQKAHIIH